MGFNASWAKKKICLKRGGGEFTWFKIAIFKNLNYFGEARGFSCLLAFLNDKFF